MIQLTKYRDKFIRDDDEKVNWLTKTLISVLDPDFWLKS